MSTTALWAIDGIRALANPTRAPDDEDYGTARSAILNQAGFDQAREAIAQWPGYAPTPLRDLPALARSFGIAQLRYKDESERFGLKSFKALGGAYAVFRVLAQWIRQHNGGQEVSASDVLGGRWHAIAQKLTVTCATDGNHGRSVAWGAQMFGCRCVIYVHATVSEGRCAAIARYGADVVRVSGNYDDSVRHADAQARANGWTVVSDTTYEGYRSIPIDVMHGYGVMASELVAEMGDSVMLWHLSGTDTTLVESYTYRAHESAADRSVGRAIDAPNGWQLFDALNPYTGSALPAGNGCAPTPGAINTCGLTGAPATSWGRLKAIYR